MYRHQLCDSNCLRTQVFGTKRDFQISMAAILKWPKIGSPSDFYLMASTFNIGGGLMSKKKTWSQTFMGGGCTVTLSGPWTNTQNDRKCTKNTFESLFINFPQDRNIFYWPN